MTIVSNDELNSGHLENVNPVGALGAVLVAKDTGVIKICDGVTPYNHLAASRYKGPITRVLRTQLDIENDNSQLFPVPPLSVEMESHSVWTFEALLLIGNIDDSGLKIRLDIPSGATGMYSCRVDNADPEQGASNYFSAAPTDFTDVLTVTGVNTDPCVVHIKGTVTCGAIPGSVSLNVGMTQESEDPDPPITMSALIGSYLNAAMALA